MKKIISLILAFCMIAVFTTGCNAQPVTDTAITGSVITLQIGDPLMTVNGEEMEIDQGRGTVPLIENGRTLLPVRAIAEAMGSTVTWYDETQTVILTKDNNIIRLTIGSNTAFLNEQVNTLDTVPVVINGRTMLPIRFIAKSFGYAVNWDNNSQTITLTLNEKSQTETMEVNMNNPGNFNFKTKSVILNSGYEMPIVGLGTYSLSDEECYNSVTALLESDGRLIDTAYMYHNEESVGRAIRDSDVPREEIFVITKLYPNQFADAENAIEEALNKLDIGYIDMMLLHHPGTNDVEAYHAMERAVEEGKIHSLGVSNFYIEEMTEFLPQVNIKPALVQNEIHPYYQESEVIDFMHEQGITVQGWYPFGGRGYTGEMLSNETINEIAQAHSKTAAQVILRWNLQKGVVVIPGSSDPDHIKENLDIFGFELTDEEMEMINSLNRNEKHDWY